MPEEQLLREEKRIFERFPARFPARLKDSKDEFGNRIFLRNVSAQGAKISTTDRFFLKDDLAVEIELPGDEYFTLRGQVVWAFRHENNIWDFGLMFPVINLLHMSRLLKYVIPPTVPTS